LHRLEAVHQGTTIRIEYEEDVYQPGSLTEMLADLMEVTPGDRVVDVGCGTGYLGIMAALLGAGEVICIDPEPNALKWTRHNASLNGIRNLKVYQGRELDPVANRQVDLIVTLPPQMPFATDFNPWRYGGRDGTDVIIKIISQAGRILHPQKGRLFLLHAGLAYPAKVRERLLRSGFDWKIVRTVDREFNPEEFDHLACGLKEYILQLHDRGLAELVERNGTRYYPIWFYRAVPAGRGTVTGNP
jgi:methylase of polypeptide subunit release factors